MTIAEYIGYEVEQDVWRAFEPDPPVTGIPECDALIEAFEILRTAGA